MALVDRDLPALTQPMLPPAAAQPIPARAVPGRKPARWFVLAGASGLALVIAGYTLVSAHGAEPAAIAAAPLAPRPADLLARIDRTFDALPSSLLDRPCTASEVAVPLILHSTLTQRRTGTPPSALEASLFVAAVPHGEIDARLSMSPRVAIVRTLASIEPRASVGSPTPGRFEGQLAVIDASTGAQLCHARILAWSSSSIVEPGISDRALRDDFAERVRSALHEAAARLQVTLAL